MLLSVWNVEHYIFERFSFRNCKDSVLSYVTQYNNPKSCFKTKFKDN